MTALRILHLSDSHLTGDGTLHSGVVDTVAGYRQTLAAFDNAGPLDLVVVSGDASDDGSPASYRILRSLTGDFALRHGAVAVYAMGNHDQRQGFRHVLGNGHPGAATGNVAANEAGDPSADTGSIMGVSLVSGFKVITLDSSVPGHTHGFLDESQLQWLRGELGTAAAQGGEARKGSIVVVHHPPVPPVTPLHQGIELQNAQDLAQALAGSDVVAVLSGHYHHYLSDFLQAGSRAVPVVVTAGIVNTNDVLAAPGHERATVGSGGTLVTIRASVTTSPAAADPVAGALVRTLPISVALPLKQGPAEVFDLTPDAVASISARIRAPRAEPASTYPQPRS